MNHCSANRGIPPSLLQPFGRPEATAKNRPAAKFTDPCTFLEDFNMEHSSASVTVSLVTVEQSGATRNQNAGLVNSPSCVYLG
jgi:hypothetical protein